MAPDGHSLPQAPHSAHFVVSMTKGAPAMIAPSTGQISTQRPHPSQHSWICNMMVPLADKTGELQFQGHGWQGAEDSPQERKKAYNENINTQ